MSLVHSVHIFRGFKISENDTMVNLLLTMKHVCIYDLAYKWAKDNILEYVSEDSDYFEVEEKLPFKIIVHDVEVGNRVFYIAISATHQSISCEESVDVTNKIEAHKCSAGVEQYKFFTEGVVYARDFFEYLSGKTEEQAHKEYGWHLVWTVD